MPLMIVITFIILTPFVLISRGFWWRAAYRSAGVTQKQVDDMEMRRCEIMDWLLEVSPRRSTTKALLSIYKAYLLPLYMAILLTIINCFTADMSDILNMIATYFPMGIISFALIGALFEKLFSKNKK